MWYKGSLFCETKIKSVTILILFYFCFIFIITILIFIIIIILPDLPPFSGNPSSSPEVALVLRLCLAESRSGFSFFPYPHLLRPPPYSHLSSIFTLTFMLVVTFSHRKLLLMSVLNQPVPFFSLTLVELEIKRRNNTAAGFCRSLAISHCTEVIYSPLFSFCSLLISSYCCCFLLTELLYFSFRGAPRWILGQVPFNFDDIVMWLTGFKN